jgi:thiosulfate/3-mercaptopyruvate sulfurtransferase
MGDPNISLIDALPAAMFTGESAMAYAGRKGHIPGAHSLPALDLVDPETGLMRSADALRTMFADLLPEKSPGVIAYCGGGIAATADAFALALLGRDDVAVYDNSLQEWAQDASCPLEVG